MANMRRRDFLILLGGAFVVSKRALAQQRLPRVGILVIGRTVAEKDLGVTTELARLGYVNGRNVIYDIRGADGNLGRLPVLARELVAAGPDVLIGASSAGAAALAAATRDIPIVMTVMIDPIATGFSDSMSRPSRNVTGFTSSSPTLSAKRLELLHELIPGLRSVAYFTVPAGSMFRLFEQYVRDAAKTMGIAIHTIPVSTVASVAEGFIISDREKVQAVMVEINPGVGRLGAHITDECMVRDLPSIHPWSFEVQGGALMSYGPTAVENNAGAAKYVNRILKGARISELPFEEPSEFKLAINLRTARAMKIAIPPTLLARADEVID